MKHLELILLRSPGTELEPLGDRIRDSLARTGCSGTSVTLYRRHGLDSDLALHLVIDDGAKVEATALASRLASELEAWGLVEHSSWEEMR